MRTGGGRPSRDKVSRKGCGVTCQCVIDSLASVVSQPAGSITLFVEKRHGQIEE
jgi:hypothetical protein